MSLKPIDTNALRDDEEQTDESFSQGAAQIDHYESQTEQMPAIHADNPRRRRAFIFVAIAALAAVIALAAIFVVPQLLDSSSTTIEAGQPVSITIANGSGDGDIASILQDAGVISSTRDFLTAVQRAGATGNLKGGTYELTTGMDYADVVDALVQGPEQTSLTIAEGLTVNQTAQRVEEVLGISADDFLAQAKASNYATDYPFLAGAYNDSLEGFLYPQTYRFGSEATADSVIRAMLDQYVTDTGTLNFSTVTLNDGTTLSQYQIVTVASLIERETASSDERPLVASVIYNRLNAGMYLQIDAAINYALGKTDLLTYEDLQVDSPYNVYTHLGLTPGPICSPSLDSIRAALNPASTTYLYYVASSALDGTHVFCSTEEEFEVARQQYNAAVGIS